MDFLDPNGRFLGLFQQEDWDFTSRSRICEESGGEPSLTQSKFGGKFSIQWDFDGMKCLYSVDSMRLSGIFIEHLCLKLSKAPKP